MRLLDGVLPIDKNEGPTSHDIVSVARRSLGIRAVGHTGTLDPFASGLLLLCLGRSTRLAEYLTGLPKSYSATIRLGVVTETDDLQGAVVSSSDGWTSVTQGRLEAALDANRGHFLQVPPRYSAKRVQGRRMYEVARSGGEVEAKPSPVTVTRLEAIRFEPPEVDIVVDCASGTYIRAIGRDIGETLGVGAHLTALRRTRIGKFDVGESITVEALADESRVASALVSPAEALADLPTFVLEASEMEAVSHGRSVPAPVESSAGATVAMVSRDGRLVAIGESTGERLQPRKVFV
ncbi:MAG: tRNA pseudouridine(55) synthase TruB [Gemmatimonas sp.]|nr:tRNA pseudouridine(55) synthase TruB [Gemmatimonas sp.]